MTIQEYGGWLEGFRDGIGDRLPTQEEWDLVYEKLRDVSLAETQPVYIPSTFPAYPSPTITFDQFTIGPWFPSTTTDVPLGRGYHTQ